MVAYRRHEFRQEPEAREAPLHAFLFDIPYFPACGIFPPRHLLNRFLATGGFDGGMSPGATWEPFEVGEPEYAALVPKILAPDRAELRRYARYHWAEVRLDPAFDGHTDYFAWLQAVCDVHRAAYHARLAELRAGGWPV